MIDIGAIVTHLLAAGVLITVTLQTTFAEEGEVPVEVEVAGRQIVEKSVQEHLPEGQFFADGEALVEYWEDMDLDIREKPDVDFTDMLLIVYWRDAADPNRITYEATRNGDGELFVLWEATERGFKPSDQIELTFIAVPRENVTGIVRYEYRRDPETGQIIDQVRVVYPL